jgi:hypothetical protein
LAIASYLPRRLSRARLQPGGKVQLSREKLGIIVTAPDQVIVLK